MYFVSLPIDIKLYILNNYLLNKCDSCNNKILRIFTICKCKLCKKCFTRKWSKLSINPRIHRCLDKKNVVLTYFLYLF